MRSFVLNENEMNEILSHHASPFFVVSTAKIAENYQFLRKHLPHADVYYAMKANPAPAILETVAGLGSNFDVASAGEIEVRPAPRRCPPSAARRESGAPQSRRHLLPRRQPVPFDGGL